MNIDTIEKLDQFPPLLKYIKLNILTSTLIFFFSFYLLFSFTLSILLTIILSLFEYNIDTKIFYAFKQRKTNLNSKLI